MLDPIIFIDKIGRVRQICGNFLINISILDIVYHTIIQSVFIKFFHRWAFLNDKHTFAYA